MNIILAEMTDRLTDLNFIFIIRFLFHFISMRCLDGWSQVMIDAKRLLSHIKDLKLSYRNQW